METRLVELGPFSTVSLGEPASVKVERPVVHTEDVITVGLIGG